MYMYLNCLPYRYTGTWSCLLGLSGSREDAKRLGARANGLVRSRVGGRCMRYRTSGIVATIVYVDNLLPLGLPSSNPLPSSSGLPHDRTALRTRVRTNEDR